MIASVAPPQTLHTLQLGKSWFPEQQGSGLDRMYHGLAESLSAAGVDVYGLVAGSPTLEGTRTVHSFAPDTAPLPRRLLGVRRAVRNCRAETPIDIVASHFALYTVSALDLLTDLPLVVHFHGPWAQESAVEEESTWAVRAKHQIEKLVYQRANHFIVLSSAFREILCSTYGISEEQVSIVPGGVDTSRFDTALSRRAAREQLDWSASRPTILSIRRLAPRMGLDNLIRAMVAVRREVPDVLLNIAGTGPLGPTLQELIEDLDLANHVRLLGFVPDSILPLAYRAADVSVVPTVALEGFGLITVESLAAGTPVIVTPNGGLPEVVSDLDESLVLDGFTPDVLADHLVRVFRDSLPVPSDEACQSYAQSRFDWSAVAAQTRHVYEHTLST